LTYQIDLIIMFVVNVFAYRRVFVHLEVTMEIKRNMYLNKLIEKKENGYIKIITGIRRIMLPLVKTQFLNFKLCLLSCLDHQAAISFSLK